MIHSSPYNTKESNYTWNYKDINSKENDLSSFSYKNIFDNARLSTW